MVVAAKAMLPQCAGPVAEVVFLNTSGGLTGGDCLDYRLEAGAGCRVLATTQTAERCYASSGGAAAAVIAGLVSLGAARINVVNRTAEGTSALLDDLRDTIAGREVVTADWSQAQALADGSRLVVNASSLGMAGMPALPLSVASLRDNAIVYDIITHPHDTPLFRSAKARGLRAHDGLEMLVGQAREAFRRFYGADAPRDADAELRSLLIR